MEGHGTEAMAQPKSREHWLFGKPPGIVQTTMTASSCNHGHLHWYSNQLRLTSKYEPNFNWKDGCQAPLTILQTNILHICILQSHTTSSAYAQSSHNNIKADHPLFFCSSVLKNQPCPNIYPFYNQHPLSHTPYIQGISLKITISNSNLCFNNLL